MSTQKSTNTSGRHRGWVWTLNNYTDEEVIYLRHTFTTQTEVTNNNSATIRYSVFGYEICPTTGTPHLQGFTEFTNARTLMSCRRLLSDRAHFEPRRGTPEQAAIYCKKGGVFEEFGTLPEGQGHRTDLDLIKKEIFDGRSVDSIVAENPTMFHQYGRTLERIEDLRLRRSNRSEPTKCTWYYGRTGSGKSKAAFTGYSEETHYVYPNDNGWWDDYHQQPVVIIDDFRGEIPYNFLLQLIGRDPIAVRRRARRPIPFNSKHIIITSSLPPGDVYHRRNAEDHIDQLLRRIKLICLTDSSPKTDYPKDDTPIPFPHVIIDDYTKVPSQIIPTMHSGSLHYMIHDPAQHRSGQGNTAPSVLLSDQLVNSDPINYELQQKNPPSFEGIIPTRNTFNISKPPK